MAKSTFTIIYNQELPRSHKDLHEFYEGFAEKYDQEQVKFGYLGPQITAKILEDHVDNKNAKILDFGSGTGLVGEQLHILRFSNIDAIDMSQKSLDVSNKKQIYKSLICSTIGSKPLDIETDTYDAIVTSGSFAPGHLTQSCFPEMIRIVKPGGIIVITFREEYLWTAEEYKDNKFQEAIDELVQQGKWLVVARTTFERHFNDKSGITFVFKILYNE